MDRRGNLLIDRELEAVEPRRQQPLIDVDDGAGHGQGRQVWIEGDEDHDRDRAEPENEPARVHRGEGDVREHGEERQQDEDHQVRRNRHIEQQVAGSGLTDP